jgi:hypothetical protein
MANTLVQPFRFFEFAGGAFVSDMEIESVAVALARLNRFDTAVRIQSLKIRLDPLEVWSRTS